MQVFDIYRNTTVHFKTLCQALVNTAEKVYLANVKLNTALTFAKCSVVYLINDNSPDVSCTKT